MIRSKDSKRIRSRAGKDPEPVHSSRRRRIECGRATGVADLPGGVLGVEDLDDLAADHAIAAPQLVAVQGVVLLHRRDRHLRRDQHLELAPERFDYE